MWTEDGVPSDRVLLSGLLLSLGSFGCPGHHHSGHTHHPAKEQKTGAQAKRNQVKASYCTTPETLQVLGSGPHGEPQVLQIVQCTPTQLQVRMPAMEQEWVFIRGGQSSDEVTGLLLLHRRKAIVSYPAEQLAIEGVAQSWQELIARLGQGVQERVTGVDDSQLRAPKERFPGYREWSFEAWSSTTHAPPAGHHHGPGGHHHGAGGHGDDGHHHGPDGHHHGEGGQRDDGHHHGADGHHHASGGHHHEAKPRQ